MSTPPTKNKKKVAAGKRGGLATVAKIKQERGANWREYFRQIGKNGGDKTHKLYKLVPINQNDFAMVHRKKGTVKATLLGIPFGRFTKKPFA